MKALFKRIISTRLQLMVAMFCIHVLFQFARSFSLPHNLVLSVFKVIQRDAECLCQLSSKQNETLSFIAIAHWLHEELVFRRIKLNSFVLKALVPLTVWMIYQRLRVAKAISDMDFLSFSDRGYTTFQSYANDIFNCHFNPACKTQFNGPGAKF